MQAIKSPDDISELGGYFPLTAIRSMLVRDESLECVPISSKGVGDLASVTILPTALGEYLKDLDPQERVFHVEQITTGTPHAEIWLNFEWKDSNFRRTRQRARWEAERAADYLYQSRISQLVAALPPALGIAYNHHLAALMLAELKSPEQIESMSLVLNQFNIMDLLRQYQREDQASNEDTNHTIQPTDGGNGTINPDGATESHSEQPTDTISSVASGPESPNTTGAN